jgi:single-stranded DNA-specific DHH superfamily exonuclease
MPKSKTRAAEKDAMTLLKEDHKKIRVRLGGHEKTSTRAVDKREELLQTIERELKIHKKLYYEALEEHHVVDTVLAKTSLTEGVLTKLVELVRPS